MTTFLPNDANSDTTESRRQLPRSVSPQGLSRAKEDPESQFTSIAPASPVMTVDLASYWRSLVRRKLTVAISLLAALAMGAVATLLTRPLYTAQTTLQIDREAEKVVRREEATPEDNLGEEFYQTQYGLLRSRVLAERVAQTQGLLIDDGFVATMTDKTLRAAASFAAARHGRVPATIGLLRSHENVVPERGSRLVAIVFKSPDPRLSARIANAYAENFIQAAMDRRYEAASYARDFLEKRLTEVKAKLEESERALVDYAASQHIVEMSSPDEAGKPGVNQSLPAANLQAYNAALSAARTDRIKAEQRWDQARAANGAGLTEILQSPTIQQLSQERAKIAAEYQDKLSIFKPDYPDMRRLSAQLAEINHQIDAESAAIKQSIHGQYSAALDAEHALEDQVVTQQGAVQDLRGRSIRYTILQREVDTNRTLYDGLLQRYKEVGVAGGVAANNISIVDRAVPSTKPSQPRPIANMLLAAVIGLSVGVFLAILRDAMDQAVRSPHDIESDLDLPMLGTVPMLNRNTTPAEALADTRSPLAEAYHSLRSALQFSTVNGFPKTLLVTSPLPGGGKSTTATALAQCVARLGFSVLLIDADLRKPTLHRLVDSQAQVGMSNLLTGSAELSEAIQPTVHANLFLLTSGPLPPNPAELLASRRLTLLTGQASALFDMVIFDGPPIMALADAPILGTEVEGTLLVVEANVTSRPQVRAALRRLEIAGARVLGVLLTRYKPASANDEYGYGYSYGYDQDRTLLTGGEAKRSNQRHGRGRAA